MAIRTRTRDLKEGMRLVKKGSESPKRHDTLIVLLKEKKVYACTLSVNPVLEAKLITQILKTRATKQAVCPVQSETCYTDIKV